MSTDWLPWVGCTLSLLGLSLGGCIWEVFRLREQLQRQHDAITMLARELGALQQRLRPKPGSAWDRWLELRAGAELASRVTPE